MQDLILRIEGMSCGHCLNAVNQALNGHPGVRLGSVQMGRAELQFDPTITDPDRIVAAVEAAGYQAIGGELGAGLETPQSAGGRNDNQATRRSEDE